MAKKVTAKVAAEYAALIAKAEADKVAYAERVARDAPIARQRLMASIAKARAMLDEMEKAGTRNAAEIENERWELLAIMAHCNLPPPD